MANPKSLLKLTSDFLKKKKSEVSVISLGDPEVGAIIKDRIPTSSRMLNYVLGGGLPCKRLVEVFGEESNGKSSLMADIMAQTQKLGGIAAIIDSEHAFDPERAKAMGVAVDDVIYSDDETVEDAIGIMEALIENVTDDDYLTIVWDSVAASPTRSDLEGEVADQAMASKARLLSKALRRLTGKLKDKTCLVFVNQVRAKIGGPAWGEKNEAAGGYAIRFHSSIRLKLTSIGKVIQGEKPIGIRCIAKTVKNKTFPPFKQAEYEMYFAGGIDDSTALLKILVESGEITQKGSWYNYGKKQFQRKEFQEVLEGLGEEGEALIAAAMDKL